MKKKILIIEDEEALCKIMSMRLVDRGFEVSIANDGALGLEKAKQEKPDLVILDLVLPKLKGEEVCKFIRKDQALENTPIIMLTAKASETDEVVGKVIGADCYLVKPCDTKRLFSEIDRLLAQNAGAEAEKMRVLRKKLFSLLEQEALKKGEFTLSSGKKSNYYLDGRVITLTPEGAFLVANIILNMVKEKKIDAIGGPTLGADPIVGAIACLSHINNIPIKTFIVRKNTKEHGTQRQIEGPALNKGSLCLLVDDVATTGKALIEAKEALEKCGCIAKSAIVIVDRLEGAKENLSQAGLELESIFDIKDFNL